MATSKPLIYAELLSNIRQISVIVALNTPCDATTWVELSENGCQIILFHHGDSQTLALPGQANPKTQLQKPALGSNELSWRLPLVGQANRGSQEDAQSCDAPWSAKSLGPDEEFMCKSCGAIVLKRGSIKIWKDLPSENWAEMMDFWHCHKPDVVEDEKENGEKNHSHGQTEDPRKTLAERGYGANSKIAARPGVGFVDITTFLVSENDCTNVTFADGKQLSLNSAANSTSFNETTTTGNSTPTNAQTSSFSFSPPDIVNPTSSVAPKTSSSYAISPAIGSLACSLPFETATKSEGLLSSDIATKSASPLIPGILHKEISLNPLRCICCSTIIGTSNSECRILKWKLGRSVTIPSSCSSLPSASTTRQRSLSVGAFPTYFPALALALLRDQLASKIFVLPLPCSSSLPISAPSLLLWVIGSALRCSTTVWSSTAGARFGAGAPVIKLFWKVVREGDVNQLRDKPGVEEMEQPAEAVVELERALRESALCLPPSSRRFQEWNVGLLEKYVEE